MDEEYEDIREIENDTDDRIPKRGKGRMRDNRLPCPTDCPKFECIIENNCNENCKQLDFAKAQICELCRHNKDCSSKLKVLMLGAHKENKVNDIIGGVAELKEEHKMLEREYRTLTDELTQLKGFGVLRKTELMNKKGKKQMEILIARKYLNTLRIKFKEDLDFAKK